MKKIHLFIAFAFLILLSCRSAKKEIKTVKSSNYELSIAPKQKAVLILFPGFPGFSADRKTLEKEAIFLQNIENEGISVLFFNVKQKLWLNDIEKIKYADELNFILDSNKIVAKNVFIGGFSSGGNVAVLLSNHLLKTKNKIEPKGVFVVDSPLDIEKLYYSSKNNVAKKAHQDAYNEGLFLVDLLERELGEPSKSLENYQKASSFTASSNTTENIDFLKNIKVRLYTEPDLEWQKTNRNRTFEDLNAAILEKMYRSFMTAGAKQTEFIQTKNKGFRADGTRHPHSWSIVDRESLIAWIF